MTFIISGDKKKQLCLSLGARSFLDYKTDNVEAGVKSLTSGLGAHAAICLANSESSYVQSMRLLRNLGVLVCVGIPNVPFRVPATPLDMITKGKAQREERCRIRVQISPHVSELIMLLTAMPDNRSDDCRKLGRYSGRNE